MPPVHGRWSRKKAAQNTIPGPKSLHRGIHVQENASSTSEWQANKLKKRDDFKELLVHHQKVNEGLKDVYARTAALHKDNMTLAERIEDGWRAFERIGGKRPVVKENYKAKLKRVSDEKKSLRSRAEGERFTGDETDYSKGSALHDLKDRRIKKFVKKQVDRAHLLKRMGDPSPIKTSGKFDRFTNTLNILNKTIRQVGRQTKHDARTSSVKAKKGRSQWDLKARDSNQHSRVVRNDDAMDVGSRKRRPGPKR